MARVVCHAAIGEQPCFFSAPFHRAHAVESNPGACHQASSGLEVQLGKSESALLAALDHRLSNPAHITFNGWVGQLVFVIGHAPSAARTEMPLAREADLF